VKINLVQVVDDEWVMDGACMLDTEWVLDGEWVSAECKAQGGVDWWWLTPILFMCARFRTISCPNRFGKTVTRRGQI
jgi:hypothetical protein